MENNIKKIWEAPKLEEILVNENTLLHSGPGADALSMANS